MAVISVNLTDTLNGIANTGGGGAAMAGNGGSGIVIIRYDVDQ